MLSSLSGRFTINVWVNVWQHYATTAVYTAYAITHRHALDLGAIGRTSSKKNGEGSSETSFVNVIILCR